MDWLAGFFNLSKGEKYGFWLLVALIILGLSLPQFIERKTMPAYKAHQDLYQQQIDQFLAADKKAKSSNSKEEEAPGSNNTIDHFKFNPNEINLSGMKRLGIPGKLAHTIINYREAGGEFNQKDDLKAIYGMRDSTYERLKPWVKLPKSLQTKDNPAFTKKAPAEKQASKSEQTHSYKKKRQETAEEQQTITPLNKADSAALTEVHGIGDFFAGEIVERRQKLGGFTHFSQLLAVYNFDSSSLKQVKPGLSLDPKAVSKLSLNNAAFETFLKHPYLKYPQVKAIFDYKDKVDTIKAVEDLKRDQILGEKTFKQIKPYLKP